MRVKGKLFYLILDVIDFKTFSSASHKVIEPVEFTKDIEHHNWDNVVQIDQHVAREMEVHNWQEDG